MVDGLSVSSRSAQFVLQYLVMKRSNAQKAVFHMLLGLPYPDLLIYLQSSKKLLLLVRGMDPDPSIIKQK